MHDDRVHPGLLQQHDVAREILGKLGIAHGMAAIFHHHGLPVVALHVGQRFGQHLGVGVHGREILSLLRRGFFSACRSLTLVWDGLVLATSAL